MSKMVELLSAAKSKQRWSIFRFKITDVELVIVQTYLYPFIPQNSLAQVLALSLVARSLKRMKGD